VFGTYRLLLASLVALSHYGFIVHGFNPGQWAVLSFYVISGFLMDRLFRKIPPSGGAVIFYVDRFLRIYPLYLIITMSTLVIDPLSRQWLLENLTLIPLNYGEFNGSHSAIGPAWSLACEVQFYLLVPVFCGMSIWMLRLISIISVLVFCISPWLPHSTFWAYIGLPGILFAFLTGMLLSRGDLQFIRMIWVGFIVLLLLFIISKINNSGLPTGIHLNVCIGYLVALPAAYVLSRLSPHVSWDQRLGLLSYPLFLVHELARKCLKIFNLEYAMLILLGVALLVSIVLIVTVEIPFDHLRYRIRNYLTLRYSARKSV
jgi:peptidoglycan/LPS O-acetylase OafA/YrhL